MSSITIISEIIVFLVELQNIDNVFAFGIHGFRYLERFFTFVMYNINNCMILYFYLSILCRFAKLSEAPTGDLTTKPGKIYNMTGCLRGLIPLEESFIGFTLMIKRY